MRNVLALIMVMFSGIATHSASNAEAGLLGLNIPAFKIQVTAAEDFDFEKSGLTLKISWKCDKYKQFSMTHMQDCGEEFSDELIVSLNADGLFEVPTINQLRPITISYGFNVNVELLQNGQPIQSVGDFGGYNVDSPTPIKEISTNLKNMTLIQIKGGSFPIDLKTSDSEEIMVVYSYAIAPGGMRDVAYNDSLTKQIEVTYSNRTLKVPNSLWLLQSGFKAGTDVTVKVKQSWDDYNDDNTALMAAALKMTFPEELIDQD